MTVSAVQSTAFARLRSEEFPVTQTTTYLNSASIAPLPQRSKHAIQHCVEQMSLNPSLYFVQEILPAFDQFREKAAAFINAPDKIDICPVVSTSTALNLIAGAIEWHNGDNIVFCDVEFPSNVYPWMALQKHGVECRIVPPQHGTLTPEALEKAVDSRTRLVAVSAVQFFTGARADLNALGAFCRARNILFAVDAIQAIGHIPIDVQAMNIDILATGGQKSLLALTGSGFLYVRRECAEQMRPGSIGPNATHEWEHWLKFDLTPLDGAARFMAGTPNVPGLMSVLSSLVLLEEVGRPAIDSYTTTLAAQFMTQLTELGYLVITPNAPALHSSIVTFQLDSSSAFNDAVLKYLMQNQVVITKHLDAVGNPFLRISLHGYNTEDDLERFFAVLSAALKECRA